MLLVNILYVKIIELNFWEVKCMMVSRRLILGLLILVAIFTLSFASASEVDAYEIGDSDNVLSLDDSDVLLVNDNNLDDDSISSVNGDEDSISSVNAEGNSIFSVDEDSDSISSAVDDESLINSESSSHNKTLSSFNNDEIRLDNDEKPDEPDLVVNNTIYLTKDNFNNYFEDGVLKSWFGGNTIIFTEDFENLGKLTIQAEDVILKGIGYNLKNTVFELDAKHIALSDLNIELDSEYPDNEYAGIAVYCDNAVLKNLNIKYIVPQDVQAYAIYAEGIQYNLQIINSTVNFEGHNDNVKLYNYALKLVSCINATVENNTFMSSLPLKDINFGANGAQLASDLVLTVGIEGCDYLSFVGNTIISEVNKRPQCNYPSLDSVFVSQSNNAIIANNSISLTDFITLPGVDNYLYALDIYNLENLSVSGNNISVITNGGKLAAGTAYPIQITGPIDNVNITYNDLFSFSNGPNIGIYSQNYYGSTALRIMYNKINVTGLAGSDEWALVAGIETQDTNSIVQHNIIEVHSVGEVSKDDNLYGVSYGQSTEGNHQYNIKDNIVFSDGYYSVNLIGSVNSSVADNLLVSYNPNATNANGFKYGDLSVHEGIEFYNNSVVSSFDYFAERENNVDNGQAYYYNTIINADVSNNVDGSKIPNGDSKKRYSYNPLIPGSGNWGIHTGEDGWTINDGGSSSEDGANYPQGKDSSDENGIFLNELLSNYIKSHGGDSNKVYANVNLKESLFDDFNSNSMEGKTNVSSFNRHSYIISNNSDVSPSDSGPDLATSKSKSSSSGSVGESESVAKKAFRIEKIEDIEENVSISPILLVILFLLLLIIGYKRKKFILE